MKLIKITVCFVLLLSFTSGCFFFWGGKYEGSKTSSVELKNDLNSHAGQLSAYSEGRIYYRSQELGRDGLYSMKEDGSDIRFEVEVPKITRLIVHDNSLYYVGINEDVHYRTWNVFRLYRYDLLSKQTEEIKYSEKTYEEDSVGYSVVDACVTENGTVCVFADEGYNTSAGSDYPTYIIGLTDDVARKHFKEYRASLMVWEDIVFTDAGEFIHDEGYAFIDAYEAGSDAMRILDSNTGHRMVFVSLYLGASNWLSAFCMDDEIIFCGYESTLIAFDAKTLEKVATYAFAGINEEMNVLFWYKYENTVYARVYDDQRDEDYLYALDLDTLASTKILDLESLRLLHIGENDIIWAQDDKIICKALDQNDVGDTIYEIQMPQDSLDGSILEITGDWLFVHREVQKADVNTHQLLYKVNLETREIVACQ